MGRGIYGRKTANTWGQATGVGGGTVADPLAALSDDFSNSATLANWTLTNGASATAEGVVDGALVVELNGSTNWFNNVTSWARTKQITGNFSLVVDVESENLLGTAEPPNNFRLGGVIAFDPALALTATDWVHGAFGAVDVAAPNNRRCESKTTNNGASVFTSAQFTGRSGFAGVRGFLRLTRVGSLFSVDFRALASDPWTPRDSFTRADMASTLAVGMMAYNQPVTPDLRCRFHSAVFSTP